MLLPLTTCTYRYVHFSRTFKNANKKNSGTDLVEGPNITPPLLSRPTFMSQLSVQPKQARRFCFTLNNPTEENHHELSDCFYSSGRVRFLLYQLERAPSTGTEHIQAYIEFNTQMRFRAVLQLLPHGVCLLASRGSANDNIEYCSKPDSRIDGPYIYGTPSIHRQGRRSDLHDALDILSTSSSVQEACQRDEFGPCYVKFHKGLERWAAMRKIPVYPVSGIRKKRVVVLWGDTGTGKTYTAYQCLRSLYPEEEPFFAPCNSGLWFDGYTGQKGVLFDDFRGEADKMPVTLFLRLTDQYPLQVQVKGGFVNWTPETIYFTMNQNPASLYSNEIGATRNAVQRRLQEVSELKERYVEPQVEEKKIE